ncbi:MAG TPA: WbqC family protein [Dissulfurispiraceae bacterium]
MSRDAWQIRRTERDSVRIGILQPGYLPWLGFFEQVYRSDVFVIYDDVQYDKEGWRNRNRIKSANGIQWLTVPVHVKFKDRPLVHEVRIDNKTNWRKKHLLSLKTSYAKAPFFANYIGVFEEAYSMEWERLADLDMHFIMKLLGLLGMGGKKIVRSSALGVSGDRFERLVSICKMFRADVFYEGAAGREYLDGAYFEAQGIKIEYQDYKHPVYRQLHGEFIPYLSVVDLLFNQGEESLPILAGKNSAEVIDK